MLEGNCFCYSPAVSLYDEVVPEIVRRQFLKARPSGEAVNLSQNTSALCEPMFGWCLWV